MPPSDRIPLARPRLEPEAEAAVRDVLRSGQLVRGARVAAFERELAERLGVPHVIATSSGTAALHVALAALGVGPGDEVVLPDLTFPSLANVIEHLGAVPVTVDVSPETYNATPDDLLAAVTPRTRAIVPVDQFGLPAVVAPLVAAEPEAAWSLVVDAACSIGGERDGVPCGTAGRVGCFSFHPRKLIVTAEGGAIATRDRALHERALALHNHGMQGEGWLRFREAGWHYRLSDVHAALAAGQLSRLSAQIAERRELARRYDGALESLDGARVPAGHRDPAHVFQSYVILVDEDRDRDAVLAGLRRRGVEATIGSYAIHLQPHYRERFPEQAVRPRPAAAGIFRRALALPLFPGLDWESQKRVVAALREALAEAPGRPAPGDQDTRTPRQ